MKTDLLRRLVADRAARRPAALVTDLADGSQALLHAEDQSGGLALDMNTLSTARAALAADRSGMLPVPGRRLFLQAVVPAPRLILVGAVHISQALAPIAALAGYGVTVVDPRRSFATDARTAIVTLTHDPKLDDPALTVALNSPAFYIGSLGSRKTHAARLKRLAAAGFDDAALARIHGPVGLSIGALSPAEIAVSILAQITASRRAGAKPAEERAA